MNTELTKNELEELKTVGIVATNWFAVSYDSNSTPIAIFSNEAHAIAYRDKFTATSIVEPWPMVIKDFRKGALTKLSSNDYTEGYKKGWSDCCRDFKENP